MTSKAMSLQVLNLCFGSFALKLVGIVTNLIGHIQLSILVTK